MIAPFVSKGDPSIQMGYLKGTDEEQYAHYIQGTTKDIYGFLRNNKEHIADVLMVGFDVKDVFVTCTPDQVRDIYINIIQVLQRPTWTLKDVMDAVRQANPDFYNAPNTDMDVRYKVERIARTELNRILFYAKEQLAMQDGDLDQLYAWKGPLDSRTTPMCRFLQTGELTGMTGGAGSKAKPYDYEYLRPQLPEWREDGWTLPELKDACRQVWQVFHDAGLLDTEMPSDWSMHINCRHSFQPVSRITIDSAIPTPREMGGWMQVSEPEPAPDITSDVVDIVPNIESPKESLLPSFLETERPKEEEPELAVEVNGISILSDMTDSSSVFVDEHYVPITFGVRYSIYGGPAYHIYAYDDSDDPVYVFDSIDENDIWQYSSFIANELESGMSEYDISWILRDEGITGNDVNYLMENHDELLTLSYDKGWGYATA